MFTPGATISGFPRPAPTGGPALEKPAIRSCLSTAPTVSALVAVPGELTPMRVPLLPAATTKSVPVCAVNAFSSSLTGSVPSVGSLPRLMLTTLAPLVAAHSMPAMIQESRPLPSSVSTLPTMSFAPGATPLYRPPDAAPEPTIVDATWVPWPWPSATVPLAVQSLAVDRPRRQVRFGVGRYDVERGLAARTGHGGRSEGDRPAVGPLRRVDHDAGAGAGRLGVFDPVARHQGDAVGTAGCVVGLGGYGRCGGRARQRGGRDGPDEREPFPGTGGTHQRLLSGMRRCRRAGGVEGGDTSATRWRGIDEDDGCCICR